MRSPQKNRHERMGGAVKREANMAFTPMDFLEENRYYTKEEERKRFHEY